MLRLQAQRCEMLLESTGAQSFVFPLADQNAIELADRAIQSLRSSEKTHSLFLLIDPTLEDPISKTDEYAKLLAVSPLARKRLKNLHEDINEQNTPYLLQIANQDEAERLISASIRIAIAEALGTFGEQYRARRVCAWIFDSRDARTLAKEIAGIAKVKKPDGAFWPMRIWDPRVLWQMSRLLNEQQFAKVTAVLASCWFFNQENAFELLKPQGTNSAEASTPFNFNAHSWSTLERVGLVNKALEMAPAWGYKKIFKPLVPSIL
jgi:Domain of unknown function (DUF4123)